MRQREQRLWDAMRKAAPPHVWLQRIENVVGEGMPDVFVAAHGSSCWVELKAAIRPKRDTTPLLGSDGLRLSQINWHIKAASVGLRTYVLIRDDKRALYLVPAHDLNARSSSEIENQSFAHTWHGIFAELEGR